MPSESGPAVDERVRALCMALPEVEERLSHGSPTFYVRGKKPFARVWPDGHHGVGFPQLWCAAGPGVQQELIAENPYRFFRPPYVGHHGWLGVRLDNEPDWTEVAEILEDAYRCAAPKTLIAVLDARP